MAAHALNHVLHEGQIDEVSMMCSDLACMNALLPAK